MSSYRIALGSIFIECNQFGGTPADLARFQQYELHRGDDILKIDQGTVGGMLQTLSDRQPEIRPLIVASTCASGAVTRPAYDHLKEELLDSLKSAGVVDGVLLALHGSGVVEGPLDLEADLIESVRSTVGKHVPVVVTLDLHAHVSEPMIQHADALVAWETYPHQDAFTTGQRGAAMLLGILARGWRPTMAMAKVPLLVGGCRGETAGPGAFAELMRLTKSFEQKPGVLSTSLFHVHPYLDLPAMGSGGLVITDNDWNQAVDLATEVAEQMWQYREELEQPILLPSDAIKQGLAASDGLVLLIETADCAGGGAAGDSVATIRALVEAQVPHPSFGIVVDPQAASQCHAAGPGAELTLQLGHNLDRRWGEPAELTGRVIRLSDGRFKYDGGIWSGTWATMGPAVVFQVGNVHILIATNATYDWADEQYRSMNMDVRQARFIVVKNPMNYRFGYQDMITEAYVLDTPGPTPASVARLQYQRIKRPYFPWDREIPDLKPWVLQGSAMRC